MFQPGQILVFDYPAANYQGVRRRMERRRLRVERVRSLEDQPLQPASIDADPLLRRGQCLVTGLDLDKKAERSFYIEAAENARVIEPPPPQNLESYRVALLELQSDPEIVFEAESARSVLNWTREWLREPIRPCDWHFHQHACPRVVLWNRSA